MLMMKNIVATMQKYEMSMKKMSDGTIELKKKKVKKVQYYFMD